LVNGSRTLARQILHYTSTENEHEQSELVKTRQRAIYRQIGFLYAFKKFLREENKSDCKKVLSSEELTELNNETNIQNTILGFHSKDLEYMNKNNG